jgi:hypothetical protein
VRRLLHIESKEEPVFQLCQHLTISPHYGELAKYNDYAINIFLSSGTTLFYKLVTYYPGVERDIFNAAFGDDEK